MASLRLAALLLAPVSALLLRDRGRNLSDPNPPIANLRMEPESKRLTWDLHGNVSAIQCFEDASFDRRATNNSFCQLFVLPKCKRSNYTVRVTLMDGETYSTWIEYPVQEGDPGAAAEDLGCEVHDQDFLTCSWAVGRHAPSDVQYYFYLEDSNTSAMWACPRYTVNAQGTHTQCRFDNVSAFSKEQHRFVVRGASRRSPIPCVELTHFLSDIEKLRAPNINATCNESLALLEWDMSSHFHKIFDYELEIQQGADPPFLQEVQEDQSFPLANPRSFTVRIRALYSPDLVGQWSARRRFVCDQEANARFPVWLSSSLMALGTLITVGTAVFLCRRYSVLKTLFPPIPHLKDPLGGTWENEKMFPWEPGRPPQEECPVAEVQVLREP
ncbi:interleukin-3 receptor subunit alpha isoform X1 [Eptesicus fuscus]|uniref:interleukin-3 receptor subunit alpha isoform X1 n=1 Tax=Eptesicus fuscus TaxID=29078 RepID=UPI0024042CBC|nr:interleukin-3 receptor subunit alpha isoform X1 [Eptesicus fuscus]